MNITDDDKKRITEALGWQFREDTHYTYGWHSPDGRVSFRMPDILTDKALQMDAEAFLTCRGWEIIIDHEYSIGHDRRSNNINCPLAKRGHAIAAAMLAERQQEG